MNSPSVSSIAENIKKSSIGQELLEKGYIRYIPGITPDLMNNFISKLEESMKEMEQQENVGEVLDKINIIEKIEEIKMEVRKLCRRRERAIYHPLVEITEEGRRYMQNISDAKPEWIGLLMHIETISSHS